MITRMGEAFFLNQLVNNEIEKLSYIALGTGTDRPTKKDTTLTKEKIRKKASLECDLTNQKLIMKADFLATEVEDVTEIGAITTDDYLISHDLFSNRIIAEQDSTVTIEYNIYLYTEQYKEEWSKVGGKYHIYQTYENNEVIGVYENGTDNGYRKMNSLDELEQSSTEYNPCSYFYNMNNNRLYVITSNGDNPDLLNISIKVR